MQPWPADSTKRSRLNHLGFLGLYRIKRSQRTNAIGAAPIGSPGWPEFAFCTASMARKRMEFIHSVSRDWVATAIISSTQLRFLLGLSELEFDFSGSLSKTFFLIIPLGVSIGKSFLSLISWSGLPSSLFLFTFIYNS